MDTSTLSTAMGNHPLPNELVDDIVGHLDGHSAALANFGRTSHKFREMTKKILYRKITVGKNPQSNDTMYLVRTLVDHPEYAPMIKDLSITSHVFKPGQAGPRPGRRRFELDHFRADGTREDFVQHRSFLQSIVDRIKAAGDVDQGPFMFFANRWITSILNRECTAFTPLLLALCPNVQTFGFELDLQNEPIYTIPWLFGFPHIEYAYEPYDIAIYGEEVQSFLPALGIHMPEATHLRTKGVNFEIVHMGFANLTTLDIDVRLFTGGHYGSSHICFGGPGYKLPTLQKAIFRLDWSELKPGPYKYRCVISEFSLIVELPRLTSITAVLERSPRQPKYLNALCAGEFDILIDQIDTGLDNLSLDDPSYPTILQQVQELNILVSDDATAFKKDFLHRLKPITNLLNAAHLRKLTLP